MKMWLNKITGILLSAILCFTVFQIPTITMAAEGAVALPQTDTAPGLYRAEKTVKLSCETQDAEIYYTTDNFMPDENSTKYTGPIKITENTNISAIAVKGGIKSAPVSFSYIIKGEEEPKLQFVAMSDLHVDTREKDEARVAKEFDVIHSIFPNADAILIGGDLINDSSYLAGRPNRSADHAIVRELIKENLTRLRMTNTKIQLCTGNHDAGSAAMTRYYVTEGTDGTGDTINTKAWFTDSANGWYGTEIKGYKFLFPNTEHTSSTPQREWLKAEMDAATNADPGKPVFITMHKPPYNTVMGGKGSASALNTYNQDLANYPQAVTFSGHTHLDLHDDRSIYQKDYTALNTGSSSYIEVDGTYWAHSGEKYSAEVAERFEMPVTQAYFVEVFDDRVEFDRVALNADWGDVKKTGYIPASTFNNTGIVMGERWTVDLKATGAEMKNSFRYTAPRESAGVAFAPGATATVEVSGSEAQVTFPQAQNVRDVKHYEMLAKTASGTTAATMKVMPENVFAPVPKTLTYPLKADLPEGETVTAEIVAVDSFGNRSDALKADGSYDVPVEPAAFTYMMTETFDSDATTQPKTSVDNWSGVAKAQIAEGQLQAVHVGPNSKGENTISYQVSVPLQPGTTANAAKIPRGKYFVSADWEMNQDGKNGLGFILCDAGTNSFGVRVELSKGKAVVKSHRDNPKAEYVTVGTLELPQSDFSTGQIRIGIDSTQTGVSKIMGVWLTPKGGAETLVPGTENADMGDIGTGLTKIMLYPPIAVDSSKPPVTGDMVGAMDNLKIWEAADTQLEKLAQKPATQITFDQIKGQNDDQQNVTQNLDLSNVTATSNGLEVIEWESSHPNIISETGALHLPQSNAEVTLTPILKFPDPEQTSGSEYVTGPGAPITVLVKVEDVVAGERVYLNETFDKELTDPAKQIIPTLDLWSGNTAEAKIADEKLNIVHTSGVLNYQMNVPLQPGNEKTTTPIPRGKTYVSWDWEMGPKTDGVVLLLCDNKGVGGNKTLGVRVELTRIQATVKSNNDTGYDTLGSVSGDFSSGRIKIGLDSTASGITKIIGIWLTPNGGSESLVEKTKDASIGDVGTGIFKMILWPNKLKSDAVLDANDVVVSMDNLKVWEPVEVAASQLYGWKDAYLTQNGEKVEFQEGTFVPEFRLQNYSGESKNVVLIAAVYRDTILEETRIKTLDQEIPSTGEVTAQLDPIEITDAAAQRIEYFVWDSVTGMHPVKRIAQ